MEKITRSSILNAVSDYNTDVLAGKYENLAAKKEKIDADVKEFNANQKTAFIIECKKSENPMIEAIKRFTFEVVKINNVQDDEDILPRLELTDAKRQFDLLDLDKKANWQYAIDNLVLKMTKNTAIKVDAIIKTEGGTVEKNKRLEFLDQAFAMKKEARKYELTGEVSNDDEFLETLQGIVDKMIGENVAEVQLSDVCMIRGFFMSDVSASLKVRCAASKKVRTYIGKMLHRILTSSSYELDCKLDKDAVEEYFKK